MIDDQAVVAAVFNAVVVDGKFGTITRGGSASFDQVTIRTSDPAFRDQSPESLVAATTPSAATAAASTAITKDQLTPIVAEAAARWSALVGAPSVDAALRKIVFEIVDIKGLALAQTVGNVVLIDQNAAGHGWFVDATPAGDSEFTIRASAGELRAQSSSPALARIDLLTVVMHELGHVLGFHHNTSTAAPDVMTISLSLGLRRLPISASGQGATAAISGPSTAPISSPPAAPISAPPPPPVTSPPPPPPTGPPGKNK